MRIVIVGCGPVGLATGKLFEDKHDVQYVDLDESKEKKARIHDIGESWCKYSEGDIYFICTPEQRVEHPLWWIPQDRLVVIRSTVMPETCRDLSLKTNHHICHFPSFSKEDNMEKGELNPERIILGVCCRDHKDALKKLLVSSCETKRFKVITTDTKTTEIAKLVANAFLSLHISFWNEINEVCRVLDVDAEWVAKCVTIDSRVGTYGTTKFGEPYGGKCLPKDIRHFIYYLRDKNFNPAMLTATERVNKKIGKTYSQRKADVTG